MQIPSPLLTCSTGTRLAAPVVFAALLAATLSAMPPVDPQGEAFEPETTPRLIVRFDGHVVQGRIAEVPGGYQVDTVQGRIVLPFELVKLTAASLEDAYLKQRNNFENPLAANHLDLAKWCYKYSLYEQATQELEAALRLEPLRSDARELLRLIDEARKQSGQPPEPPVENKEIVLTAAGISPETHAEYIKRIQPLLVNKCGNATCHGRASQNTFRLENVRTGQRHQRAQSDENISQVLGQIDIAAPHQSPLLAVPLDPDSRYHSGVFFGHLGRDQIAMIREWIDAVVTDSATVAAASADEPPGSVPVESIPSASGPAIYTFPVRGGQRRDVTPIQDVTPTGGTSEGREASGGGPLIETLRREQQADAFDPAVFNRRVHGGTSSDR